MKIISRVFYLKVLVQDVLSKASSSDIEKKIIMMSGRFLHLAEERDFLKNVIDTKNQALSKLQDENSRYNELKSNYHVELYKYYEKYDKSIFGVWLERKASGLSLEDIRKNPAMLSDIKGKEHNFKIFSLNSFERRKNLSSGDKIVSILSRLEKLRDKQLANEVKIGKLRHEFFRLELNDQVSKIKGVIIDRKFVLQIEGILSSFDSEKVAKLLESNEYYNYLDKSNNIANAILKEGGEYRREDLISGNRIKNYDQYLSISIKNIISSLGSVQIRNIFEKLYLGNKYDIKDVISIRDNKLICGSFNLELSGEKKGLWYRFSLNEGGDLFNLIEKMGGYNKKESFVFLSESAGISIDSSMNFADAVNYVNSYIKANKDLFVAGQI